MKPHEQMRTVSEIVAADARTAGVLEQFGVDFCCGGRRTLDDACRVAGADIHTVAQALEALPLASEDDDDAARWPIPRLIDFIVSTHHAYVRSAIPAITRHLTKLVEVHGARHPELARTATVFDQIGAEMSQHMMKEERVLFPYVRDLAEAAETCGRTVSPFGTVANPIRMMEREHQDVGDALRLIRELTGGYVTPEDGCTTYGAAMAELRQFERDLHRHVHLENNVLFPAAIRIEDRLCGSSESRFAESRQQ
jgi:regulator of cell morphogenesis and NO signaling